MSDEFFQFGCPECALSPIELRDFPEGMKIFQYTCPGCQQLWKINRKTTEGDQFQWATATKNGYRYEINVSPCWKCQEPRALYWQIDVSDEWYRRDPTYGACRKCRTTLSEWYELKKQETLNKWREEIGGDIIKLREALRDRDRSLQQFAISELTALGHQAVDAVPDLLSLLIGDRRWPFDIPLGSDDETVDLVIKAINTITPNNEQLISTLRRIVYQYQQENRLPHMGRDTVLAQVYDCAYLHLKMIDLSFLKEEAQRRAEIRAAERKKEEEDLRLKRKKRHILIISLIAILVLLVLFAKLLFSL